MDKERDKFTESEMIVGGLGALLVDGGCALADIFSAGVGAAVTPVVQLAATGAIEWWVDQKGGNLGIVDAKRIGKYASNLLPAIPTVSAIFLTSVLTHNHPKITGVAAKATGKPN